MTAGPRVTPRARRRSVAGMVAVCLAVLLAGFVAAPSAYSAEPAASALQPSAVVGGVVPAADLSAFQAGNIVSDAVFFASGTMTEAQIQSFLEAKVPTCQAGYTCLKDWYDTSRTTAADPMCAAYSGGVSERASRIIFKVAQACGINPQVLIVMLQKEQGLVLHTWPSTWRYTIAMGQGCPDTAACDTQYYGFFNQVYGAARQLKRYANPPGTSNYFTWYAPGHTWNVRFSPDASCGSSPVYIQNQATADLYYYTPYQPNAAALRAGYGEGDACSAYGNRNFYQYFTDWFGSTQVPTNACSVPPASSVAAAGGEFTVDVATLNGRRAPSTSCDVGKVALTQGTVLTKLGDYQTWSKVRVNGQILWVATQYLVQTPPVAYTTDRIGGVDRYATAAAVSHAAFPNGSSTVFLASGEDFPDALSGGAAAGHLGAALLLTTAASVPDSVRAEIIRLKPTKLVVVGGVDRVSDAAVAAITSAIPALKKNTSRIAGRDRYETSRLVATTYFKGATSAYVATGKKFADAVVVAALGGATDVPVILVDGRASTADKSTLSALRTLGSTSVSIAGDTASVSGGIEAGFRAAGFGVQRYGGADRYATSLLLDAAAFPGGAANAIVATGVGFPDALTGSVLAANRSAPLFTSPTSCLPDATKDWMNRSSVQKVTLIGGLPSLSADVARSVRC